MVVPVVSTAEDHDILNPARILCSLKFICVITFKFCHEFYGEQTYANLRSSSMCVKFSIRTRHSERRSLPSSPTFTGCPKKRHQKVFKKKQVYSNCV